MNFLHNVFLRKDYNEYSLFGYGDVKPLMFVDDNQFIKDVNYFWKLSSEPARENVLKIVKRITWTLNIM